MRKLKYILSSVFALVLSIFVMLPQSCDMAKAEASTINSLESNIEEYTKSFVDAGVDSSEVHNRSAGSFGEKQASSYITAFLDTLGLEAVNNLSTINGVQTFDVSVDGGLCQSQNVIYKKPSGVQDAKKVIIATHYDNEGYYKTNDFENIYYSEGVYSSGAGVGVLLALAEEFSSMSFGFDIEFVFFGSHYAGLAGAEHYTSLISDEEAEDILLMINLDKVVSGGDLYLYTGEYPNESDEFVCSTVKNVVEGARYAYDYRFVADTTLTSVTGLDYVTVALESESAHFIRRNVKVLNILSVDDSNIGNLGIINYTNPVVPQNDTWSALQEKYGDKLISGLGDIANGVIALITSNNFVSAMSAKASTAYSIFGDAKMAVFVTAILMVIFVFVALLIHRRLSTKAEEEKRICNFDAVMAEMGSRTYESVEELVNEVTHKIDELNEKKDKAEKEKQDKSSEEQGDTHKDNDVDKK